MQGKNKLSHIRLRQKKIGIIICTYQFNYVLGYGLGCRQAVD